MTQEEDLPCGAISVGGPRSSREEELESPWAPGEGGWGTLCGVRPWLSVAVAVVACSGGGEASETDRFPPGEAGARALLGELLRPGADVAGLHATLRPREADYDAVYGDELGPRLAALLGPQWDRGEVNFGPKEGQVALTLWGATSEELRAAGGNAGEFPSGYKKVAGRLQPGLVLYRFKFTRPGEDHGTAGDGLVHVGGRWVLIPRPWRALGE